MLAQPSMRTESAGAVYITCHFLPVTQFLEQYSEVLNVQF